MPAEQSFIEKFLEVD